MGKDGSHLRCLDSKVTFRILESQPFSLSSEPHTRGVKKAASSLLTRAGQGTKKKVALASGLLDLSFLLSHCLHPPTCFYRPLYFLTQWGQCGLVLFLQHTLARPLQKSHLQLSVAQIAMCWVRSQLLPTRSQPSLGFLTSWLLFLKMKHAESTLDKV